MQPIIHSVSKIFNMDFEKKIIFESNNAMGHLLKYIDLNGSPKKPTFIFIHHLISHWPYLVDSNCNFEKNPGKTNIVGIRKSFECNKKLILKVINLLSKKDENAIVVIQSDHNWELSYEDDSTKYGKRTEIFNLIKVGDNCKKYLSSKINNVNAIRLALFCANDVEPVLLEFNEN